MGLRNTLNMYYDRYQKPLFIVENGTGTNEVYVEGKEINDECSKCGNILECELFRQGHGIKQERENVAKMIECQMKHREDREK